MRYAAALAMVVVAAPLTPGTAHGQLRDRVNIDRLNRRLAGHVVEYTHNHGADHRIYSPILGRMRDLYVYLPPGYTPGRAYPLLVYLHMGFVDEHSFVGSRRIHELDEMVRSGAMPPVVVAMPDGTVEGENRLRAPHSMFLNGVNGRFEDHLLYEVIPFVTSRFSVRPEREAHAIMGASAGGLGAMSIALRHADFFGAAAVIGAPLNLRYTTCFGDPKADFDPATFRWKTGYDPDETIARFYLGLRRTPARRYIAPVFGDDPALVAGRVAAANPADLLFAAGPTPFRPAMYVNYGGRDNYNFDAHAESFA